MKAKSDHTPEAGYIMYEKNGQPGYERLFLIAAITHDEIALVRLLRKEELKPGLEKRCLYIENPVSILINDVQTEEQLFADTSRVIIKSASLPEKYSNRIAGRMHKRDIRHIIKAMLVVTTISQAVKNKFFSGL